MAADFYIDDAVLGTVGFGKIWRDVPEVQDRGSVSEE